MPDQSSQVTYEVTSVDHPAVGDLFYWPLEDEDDYLCECVVNEGLTQEDLRPLRQFQAELNLRPYNPVFRVSDKLDLYVNEQSCFWFRRCCMLSSIAGYYLLEQVTTIPVVRLKTDQEHEQDRQFRTAVANHIKRTAQRVREREAARQDMA